MKGSIFTSFIALMVLSCFSAASIETYQFQNAGSYAFPLYPGLNLEGSVNGKVVIDRTDQYTIKINRIEIEFPNANNLVLTQFKGSDRSYHTVSQRGWVFKKIMVTAELDPQMPNHIFIRGFVVENDNQLNAPDAPEGQMLFDIASDLENVTPNPLADSVSTMVDGKRAYIKLYQNPIMLNQTPDHYFVFDVNHLGHGSYRNYLRALGGATAVALVLKDIDGEPVYAVRFKDVNGYESETSFERLDTLVKNNP